jgi:hypothetical protein
MSAEAMIERAAALIVFGIAVLSLLGALWPVQYGVFACYGPAFCEVVPGYGDTDSQSCYQMAYQGNQAWEQMGANVVGIEAVRTRATIKMCHGAAWAEACSDSCWS